MSIEDLPHTFLTPGELSAVGARILLIYKKSPIHDEHLEDLLDFIKEHRDGILSKYKKKKTVKASAKLNKARYKVLSQMKKNVRGKLSDFDPTIANAAKITYGVLRSHNFGNLRKSYELQSTTVRSLLKKFKSTNLKPHIKILRLQKGINQLKKIQDDFDQAIQDELAKATKKTPSVTAFTKLLSQVLQELLVYLRSRARKHADRFGPNNAKVNKVVKEFATKARTRKKKTIKN